MVVTPTRRTGRHFPSRTAPPVRNRGTPPGSSHRRRTPFIACSATVAGPITWRRLLARYHTPAAALAALPDLAQAGGKASPPLMPSAADARREFEQTEETAAGDLPWRPRTPAARVDRTTPLRSQLRERRAAGCPGDRDCRRPQCLRRRPAARRDAGRGSKAATDGGLRPRPCIDGRACCPPAWRHRQGTAIAAGGPMAENTASENTM